MRAKVAVATVQGKAYFLLVNALKKSNLAFLSLIPGEAVPTEAKVVITTEKEKHLINHERVLIYDSETEPDTVVSEVAKILQGRESCEKMVIGVDPGEVFGLAVIADGGVIDTENCFNVQGVLKKIKSVLKSVNTTSTVVSVKIGDGVPAYKALLELLDDALPSDVTLEVVSEAGTNRYVPAVKHGRGFRHIVSAMRIAGRAGYVYSRRKTGEQDS